MSEIFFNTHEVAQMLQVDKSTVKRWTDEGKLQCFRTPGGHRKFRTDDVYNFMSTFHYGVSSVKAVPQMATDEAIVKKIVLENEFNVLVSVCFNAAIKGKKNDALSLFIEIHRAGLEMHSIFDNVLRPALKKINDTFSANKISAIEYQIANTVLEFAVIQLGDNVHRKNKNNKSILLASKDYDAFGVELKALATLFEYEGYEVLNAGTGVDAESINQLVYRTKPFAVCLCAATIANEDVFQREFETILHTTKENMSYLIAGGRAFESPIVRENFIGITPCASYKDFSMVSYYQTENTIKI
ncbi:MAG: MerR family transcriptional regulator [Bacteroidota bacterium]